MYQTVIIQQSGKEALVAGTEMNNTYKQATVKLIQIGIFF